MPPRCSQTTSQDQNEEEVPPKRSERAAPTRLQQLTHAVITLLTTVVTRAFLSMITCQRRHKHKDENKTTRHLVDMNEGAMRLDNQKKSRRSHTQEQHRRLRQDQGGTLESPKFITKAKTPRGQRVVNQDKGGHKNRVVDLRSTCQTSS